MEDKGVAGAILEGVGGTANVHQLVRCSSRLRFEVADAGKVSSSALNKVEGVIQVVEKGTSVQVVLGAKTEATYKELVAAEPALADKVQEKKSSTGQNILGVFTDLVAGIIFPVIGVVAGAGVLKAVLIVLNTFGLIDAASGTYRILYAAGDGVFTFLPVFLGYTSAKKFGGSPFLGVAVAAGLLSQDLASATAAGESIDFLGIPVTLVTYTSNVMPIILATFVMSKVEKWLAKRIPNVVNFFVPMLTLAIVVPLTFVVIGPVMNWVGLGMANGYRFLVNLNPIVAGGILGLVWPVLIVFGLQRCFLPIVLNNIATFGYDTLFVITAPHNFSQAGACLGVLLKTKRASVKELARPAVASAFFAGITEPAIYGINLKFKRPFYISMVFEGIAGAIVAASGAYIPTIIGSNVLTLPAYLVAGVGPFVGFITGVAIAFFGSAICTYLFGYNDSLAGDEEPEQ